MNLIRDRLGFIDLNDIEGKNKSFCFKYSNKIYFYKPIREAENIYNELIASELARDYKIDCLSYDIATYDETLGVISESFIKSNEKYIPMEQILISVYGKKSVEQKNNLEDIWYALDVYYKDINITRSLMDKIINIFIFDILIGNIDRHSLNYGIIESDKSIDIAPLFDNEKMLSEGSIYYGEYSIGIDQSDYSLLTRELSNIDNYIYKFINISDSYYLELLKEKLQIISSENINKIICRIEEKINTEIPQLIKNKIVKKFDINRKMIYSVLNSNKHIKQLCK